MKKVKDNDGLPIVISSDSEEVVYTHTDLRKKHAKERQYEANLHFKSDDEDEAVRTIDKLM
jgi:5'-3' exonuclease